MRHRCGPREGTREGTREGIAKLRTSCGGSSTPNRHVRPCSCPRNPHLGVKNSIEEVLRSCPTGPVEVRIACLTGKHVPSGCWTCGWGRAFSHRRDSLRGTPRSTRRAAEERRGLGIMWGEECPEASVSARVEPLAFFGLDRLPARDRRGPRAFPNCPYCLSRIAYRADGSRVASASWGVDMLLRLSVRSLPCVGGKTKFLSLHIFDFYHVRLSGCPWRKWTSLPVV